MKLEFSQQGFEKSSNIKIRPVGVELFHADGHLNRYDAFRSFSKAPNDWSV